MVVFDRPPDPEIATNADRAATSVQSISGNPFPDASDVNTLATWSPSRSPSPSISIKPLLSLFRTIG